MDEGLLNSPVFGVFFIYRPCGQWQFGWVCLFQLTSMIFKVGQIDFFVFPGYCGDIERDDEYGEQFEPLLAQVWLLQ